MTRLAVFAVVTFPLLIAGTPASAGDWPTFRGDAARSGHSVERLSPELKLAWTHRAIHAPVPAWPGEDRMTFDLAPQPVVADGALLFGSSADGGVYALDAASGERRWSFYTGGPVRFAPACWQRRVLVASDDGYLYCLTIREGKLLWKQRGGPSGQQVIGNQRVISRWPCRGGPVVVDGTVFFAAGIWPADGVYVHALDAATGKPLWVNDQLGSLVRSHPHQVDEIPAGIAAQGHLAVSGDLLLIPTGRSTPLACDRATGELKYFHPAKSVGGAGVMVIDSLFYNGQHAYNLQDGELALGSTVKHTNTSRAPVAATKTLLFRGAHDGFEVIHRNKPAVSKQDGRRLLLLPNVKQKLELPAAGEIIAAGDTAIAGGDGTVTMIDGKTLETIWSANVTGAVHGLAVANGRLYVSTDTGAIHCFAAEAAEQTKPLAVEQATESPYGENRLYAAAAEEILQKGGLTHGYCLDLACGEGQLAYELARRSDFYIVGLEKDPAKVEQARTKLAAAGLLGVRVIVLPGDPAAAIFPKHFANLVVAGSSIQQPLDALAKKEAARCQRPWGGTICTGAAGKMQLDVRGPLEGAGEWTHLYGSAANPGSSGDRLAKGPLRMFWFGGPKLEVPTDTAARQDRSSFKAGCTRWG